MSPAQPLCCCDHLWAVSLVIADPWFAGGAFGTVPVPVPVPTSTDPARDLPRWGLVSHSVMEIGSDPVLWQGAHPPKTQGERL